MGTSAVIAPGRTARLQSPGHSPQLVGLPGAPFSSRSWRGKGDDEKLLGAAWARGNLG